MTDNDQFDLGDSTCEACRAGAPAVTEEQVAELAPQVPDWDHTSVNGVPRLCRTFEFEGWMPAVEFTNKLAQAAESNGHHPLIKLEWGRVTVSWWTHKIGGLHKNDFIMAAKTDVIWRETTENSDSGSS